MDKRRIGIGVAVVAGLVLLVFVGKWFIGQRSVKKQQAQIAQAHKQIEKQAKQAFLTLHQVCQYADSVGVDTTRFGVTPTKSIAEADAKLADLLLEIRYGKKPSRLAFSSLKETIDSSWSHHTSGYSKPALLTKISLFLPYSQLIGHYNRLRKLAKTNPSIADSLRLIRQTLNFYRYINRFNAEQFVVVNIPAGELNVFDRVGKRLLPMQVIAGKPDKRTPCMTTSIQGIVAYPYWNVPRDIALEEMLPRMKRDLAYVYNQNLQILDERDRELDPEEIDWDGVTETNFPYRVRQASGCDNSLGLLKFELVNPLAIYLHDTNSRDLFAHSADRWRSHGCVRVQKPAELANLVLGAATFDADFMNKCLGDQKPRMLRIPKPFPVFITYNIADVDATGKLCFYNDVYGLDK